VYLPIAVGDLVGTWEVRVLVPSSSRLQCTTDGWLLVPAFCGLQGGMTYGRLLGPSCCGVQGREDFGLPVLRLPVGKLIGSGIGGLIIRVLAGSPFFPEL